MKRLGRNQYAVLAELHDMGRRWLREFHGGLVGLGPYATERIVWQLEHKGLVATDPVLLGWALTEEGKARVEKARAKYR